MDNRMYDGLDEELYNICEEIKAKKASEDDFDQELYNLCVEIDQEEKDRRRMFKETFEKEHDYFYKSTEDNINESTESLKKRIEDDNNDTEIKKARIDGEPQKPEEPEPVSSTPKTRTPMTPGHKNPKTPRRTYITFK